MEQKIRTTTYEINGILYVVEAVETETATESAYTKVKRMLLNANER